MAERKFRQDLLRKWGVAFNHLHTFANVPLGRFRFYQAPSVAHIDDCRVISQRHSPLLAQSNK